MTALIIFLIIMAWFAVFIIQSLDDMEVNTNKDVTKSSSDNEEKELTDFDKMIMLTCVDQYTKAALKLTGKSEQELLEDDDTFDEFLAQREQIKQFRQFTDMSAREFEQAMLYAQANSIDFLNKSLEQIQSDMQYFNDYVMPDYCNQVDLPDPCNSMEPNFPEPYYPEPYYPPDPFF